IAVGREPLELDEQRARLVAHVDDAGRRAEHGEPEHRNQDCEPARLHAAILSATRSTALRARGLRRISASPGKMALPMRASRGRAPGGTVASGSPAQAGSSCDCARMKRFTARSSSEWKL